MALSPGTKLGPYEIIAPLGAGGMGEVYRARDPQLNRDVAIKILPASLSRDPDRLRRFEQEARAAAALNHPNILAVYQLGTHEGAPYLVSELLEGSTLRDQLLRGAMPLRKAVDYTIQTAHGLAAAHEKGIVHRDLKPDNLFLTRDGRIKILDFGLAKLIQQPPASDPGTPTLTEGTEPGVVLGTAGYMSPEQVRGQAADDRTDIFALGAILYEMLTGKRAFHKPTSAETMSAILNEEPPTVTQSGSAIPPALQKVVQRCLEKSPQQRFHSASDLAFALEALSDAGTAPTAAFAVPASRKGLLWMVAAASAFVIIVLAAFSLLRSRPVPVVESVVQLTNDGQVKAGGLETDASRIYFNEGPAGSFRIAQVSINGGQTAEIPTPVLNPEIAGLTGDGSSILVLSGAFMARMETMWLVPLPAGQTRRIGDSDVLSARVFPDGRLLYLLDSGTFVADGAGSSARKLDELSKYRSTPQISPDGTRLTFHTDDFEAHTWVLYESAADGSDVHPILKWAPGLPTQMCCMRWTANGKYLVFRGSSEDNRWDLWALPEHKRFFGGASAPVRLTNGPLSYSSIAPGRDEKRIYAVGALRRGELLQYDTNTRQFHPFLGGISALDATFSRDGRWVAYQSYPEHSLWRSRTDGSEPLQLTYPPLQIDFERISPDGSQVAFNDGDANVYVVSINGGTPRKLADHAVAPDWSPDGNSLVVTSFLDNAYSSRLIDIRSGKISPIPNSEGTVGAWFVSQDALIATANDQSKLVRYDFKTQKWSDVVTSPDKFVNWQTSPDWKYFIYSTGGNNPTVFRMRLSDAKIETLLSLKNVHYLDEINSGPSLMSAPDGSVLVTRDIGTQEVYAISVNWP